MGRPWLLVQVIMSESPKRAYKTRALRRGPCYVTGTRLEFVMCVDIELEIYERNRFILFPVVFCHRNTVPLE
jgi:hypothetical protein